MLWSLIKILAFVALVTALTYGAVQLLEASGQAEITVAGYEITLNALEMAAAGLALILLVWISLKYGRWMAHCQFLELKPAQFVILV